MIYVLYGQAGARWEQAKKDELENMLADVSKDIQTRGSVPACIVGDLNVQVQESRLLQKLLDSKILFDAQQLGTSTEQAKPTSHKGSGSRIDFVLANHFAAGFLKSYNVVPGILPQDHSEVRVKMDLSIGHQTRYVVHQPNNHHNPQYDRPPPDYNPSPRTSCPEVVSCLAQNKIDQAFRRWCDHAQKFLHKIPQTTGNGITYNAGTHRGQVRFQKQCIFPKQKDAHTLNLKSRRIAAALGRIQELQRSTHHGQQSDNTWKKVAKVLPDLPAPQKQELQQILQDRFSQNSLNTSEVLLRTCLKLSQSEDKTQGLKAWKARMAHSEKYAYQWLRSKDTNADETMRLADGTFTADTQQQLNAAHAAWMPLFQKFATKLPDLPTFEEHFVPFMKSSQMSLSPLAGPELVDVLSRSKNSAPSLDGWAPQSLIALSLWFPDIFNDLAAILNWIEEHSIWPKALCQAYASLIPKSGMSTAPSPLEFRPISVLSSIYRLWAKARFAHSLPWQELWSPSQVWGCRQHRGAETLCLQLALHMEQSAVEQQSAAGGIAFDFAKCFDQIPFQLLFRALEVRGMDNRIINPLKSMYDSLHRVFRLRGSCGPWWIAKNGLLQGCPLSMIASNSVVSTVLEVAQVKCPEVIGRTYADDISATCIAPSTDELVRSISNFFRIVQALEEIQFGEIATKKSVTFGHPCLKSKVHPEYDHFRKYKIVSGSFISESQNSNASDIESGRFAKWHESVLRMRHCPLPWRDKFKMLLATSTQATYGQGTHSCGVPEEELTKIRSNIIRAMFSVDFYSLNPNLSFAILLPAQLDPLFCHIYQGLRTLARGLKDDSF